jgi:hypothetical protein
VRLSKNLLRRRDRGTIVGEDALWHSTKVNVLVLPVHEEEGREMGRRIWVFVEA